MAAFANEVRTLKCSHILAAPLADLWLFEIDNILAGHPPIGDQESASDAIFLSPWSSMTKRMSEALVRFGPYRTKTKASPSNVLGSQPFSRSGKKRPFFSLASLWRS